MALDKSRLASITRAKATDLTTSRRLKRLRDRRERNRFPPLRFEELENTEIGPRGQILDNMTGAIVPEKASQ